MWHVHFLDINKIELKIGGGFASGCGGRKIKIRLENSDKKCATIESGKFSHGALVNWQNSKLQACRRFRLTSQTKIYIENLSTNDFCPEQIKFYTTIGSVKTETFNGWFESGKEKAKGKAWKLNGKVPGAPPSLAQDSFNVTLDKNKKQLNVEWHLPNAEGKEDFDVYLVR